MAGKNTAVFGIYPDRNAVEEAVEHLRSAGFRSTDVSVLFPDNKGTKDFAHEKNTKAPEGATTGGLAGGIAGGVLGWLTGIGALAIPGLAPPGAAGAGGAGAGGSPRVIPGGVVGGLTGIGARTIPGLGPLVAAGPIVAAVAGAGAGGTLGGI